MRRGHSPERIGEALTIIPDLTRSELITRWIAAYGQSPPKGLSHRLLEYAAAHHVQVQTYGGPSPALHGKLRHLVRSDRGNTSTSKSKASVVSKTPPPGTRLVREWHGETYTVEVLEKGFLCDGELYRSLSEVARAITGARWSGPRFFGL